MSNLHLVKHPYRITQGLREKALGQRARVIWFTGLSGSGKSTLADMLEVSLFEAGMKTYLLDGDGLRKGLNSDLDFSLSGRTENIRRVAEVCALFADAGLLVLSAFVSPLEKDRQRVRETVGADRYIEVFVDCPLEVCEQRDVKGLYAKARQGIIPDFTGISSPFEPPAHPHIHLKTAGQHPEESFVQLMKEIEPLL